MIIHQSNAAALRRWAMQCSVEAEDPHASGDERERLLKMRNGLLEMAEMQDWLDGRQHMRMTAQPVSGLRLNVPGPNAERN